MTYAYLPQIERHIRKYHDTFAGCPADECLSILGNLNARISANGSALIGATYKAHLSAENGNVNTVIYVGKNANGTWEVIESSEDAYNKNLFPVG